MSTRRLFLQTALLPTGWASDVCVDIVDGVIQSVTPKSFADDRESIAGIALPGLPNLHSHTFQRAMTGLSEVRGPTGDDFWTWRQVMYSFLQRLKPDDVESIAAFAMMEMLEAGFTSLAEFHYLHHDPAGRPYADPAELAARIVAAAQQTGMGLTLLPVLYTYGGFGAAPPAPGQIRFINNVARYAALLERSQAIIAGLDDAVLGIAPHSLRAVSAEELRDVLALGVEGPIHVHVAEQTREVDDCLAWSGQRPVEWLLAHAPVDRSWCLIHATQTTPAELAAVAGSGAAIGLCPITEANLGDGVFDAPHFLRAGGRVGIGTDANAEITAPGELRMLEYAQRLRHRARNVLAAAEGASTGRTLYDAALAGGAQALGRAVGRLEPGCRADLVVLDRDHPDLASAAGDRCLDAYLFSAGRAAIASVIVAGRTLVSAGRHRARDTITARYKTTLAGLL